ncbi:MAG: hypothetical protein NTY53_16730 [Kiritimatiellaeota bacterium]|nr:hypothetical protein [Kiritimatiellota bacterium]
MVWLFSAGLWLLLAAALWRAVRCLDDDPARARVAGWGALGLLVLAVPLYFRPHEELLGGEDPGAYINSAATFARIGQIHYTDPLLVQVPPAQRGTFFYGHDLFQKTKDACLWVKDQEKAEIGPWFQPAYSVLLALPLKCLPGWCALYGAPLLALLSALALAALGAQLFGRRRGGILVMLFFLLLPVVFWNGRSPCAEWGAVLFFWLSLALIAKAWRAPGGKRVTDFTLGAACLFVAPFFHITAWFGVIPVLLMLLMQAARGRRLFILALPVATLGALGFVVQLVDVTDCYNLLDRIPALLRHPATIIGVATTLTLLLLALNRRRVLPVPLSERAARNWAIVLWVLLLLAGAATWLGRDELGHLPFLPSWLVAYFSLTNMKGLGVLVSRFALLAALAGWGAWLLRRGPHADLRLCLAAALLPGLLLTGWMNNYMFESRRMLLFPAPLMALCLTALVLWVWEQRVRWARTAALALSLVLLAVMWRGRTHLATHTDAAGLHRIFAELATTIQKADGWLFAEYSQTTAPMEHLFGIPTLALDSDYHAGSAPLAEQTWAALLRANPQRACFFMTPFGLPRSALLSFTPVQLATYHGRFLRRELGQLPRQIVDDELTLSLYRVALRTPDSVAHETLEFPQTFAPDRGTLGLTGFANLRTETWGIRGLPLAAGAEVNVPLASDAAARGGDELVFIFNGALVSNAPPRIVAGLDGVKAAHWMRLGDDWWALSARGTALRAASTVQMTCAAPALLTDVLIHRDDAFHSLAGGWPDAELRKKTLLPLLARWTLPQASFTLPAPCGATGDLFLFMIAPDAGGAAMNLCVGKSREPVAVASAAPRWYLSRSAAIGHTPENPIVTLATDQPWRLNIRGFPPELGVLFVRAVAAE